MRRFLILLFIAVGLLILNLSIHLDKFVSKPAELEAPATWQSSVSDQCSYYLQDASLFSDGWDTLSQIRFWRKVIRMDPQLGVVSVSDTREMLGMVDVRNWERKSSSWRRKYKDSIRKERGISKSKDIFITAGRNHFYHFDKAVPGIDKAVDIFLQEGADPWYAQAILLIESPGRLARSTAGALGSFQLMPGVAREHGLIVNSKVDERKDFEKSAMGAARLIRDVCVPETISMLRREGIPYQENETWFRLMVMHVYHAGKGNVRGALRRTKSRKGGMELIRKLWLSKYRRFGNASQNYSQIALASILELHEMEDGEEVCGRDLKSWEN